MAIDVGVSSPCDDGAEPGSGDEWDPLNFDWVFEYYLPCLLFVFLAQTYLELVAPVCHQLSCTSCFVLKILWGCVVASQGVYFHDVWTMNYV
jgi:hypothetical protein